MKQEPEGTGMEWGGGGGGGGGVGWNNRICKKGTNLQKTKRF